MKHKKANTRGAADGTQAAGICYRRFKGTRELACERR